MLRTHPSVTAGAGPPIAGVLLDIMEKGSWQELQEMGDDEEPGLLDVDPALFGRVVGAAIRAGFRAMFLNTRAANESSLDVEWEEDR